MTTETGTCYNIDGKVSPGFDSLTYVPCNHTAVSQGQHSACCAPGDKCLTNGLCQYSGTKVDYNEWWRVGCTDPTYKDPACPKFCSDIERDDPDLPTHLVFQCPGQGKWCCATGHIDDFPKRGTVNTTCCAIEGLAFDDVEAVRYTTARAYLEIKTSIAVPEASSSPTQTFASAPIVVSADPQNGATQTGNANPVAKETVVAESAPPATGNSNSSSNNLVMGLGFGLGIPVAMCILLFLIFLFRRLRSSSTSSSSHLHPNSAAKWPTSPHPSSHFPNQHRRGRSTGFLSFIPLRRRRHSEHWSAESQEDLRRTYPHIFAGEAGGKELAVELDGRRSPVEVWGPTGAEKEERKEIGWGMPGPDMYR